MVKTVIKIYTNFIVIGIFGAGIFLLGISIWFDTTLSDFWKTFLHVVGIAFIAVALTAPISEFFQFQTLSQRMNIIRGAQDSGIVNIFKSRVEDEDSFKKSVNEAFDQANNVRFLGIAFPRTFHFRPFSKPIDNKMFDPKIPIKILLLNPKGVDAKERAKIEVGHATIDDINHSIGIFEVVLKERAKSLKINTNNISDQDIEKINMKVHHYDFPPINFMIMTDKCLFTDQYHFGRLSNDRPGECIGGRVTIFQYSSHSLTYERMKAHFDYIWTNKSVDITEDLLKNHPST